MTAFAARARPKAEAEFQAAALRAQELVTLVQALEARVSDLSVNSPESAVAQGAELVRASALQIAGLVHELLIRSERVAIDAARRAADLAADSRSDSQGPPGA
jgi:phage-related minor tail protein